ncbi:ABC transporter ATP-binding protein [Paraconexibacter algicola]|uniref:ABC transporter n=1 Tax=Paraconexibacter algicola TaxID=2133960 RepID=A0A2T4UFZ5_9ACTN|nr:ATP-binding cassette domain-containing protein [Paraconexibacter algicola]PTL58173.1 ABC transporter [Paraconexibacter algicola]
MSVQSHAVTELRRDPTPESLAARLRDAFASEPDLATQVHHAQTSVELHLEGQTRTVTLLLDRRVPAVSLDEPGEVTLRLDRAATRAYADGMLALPAALHRGQVTADGPVRKLLEVDPIVRRLVRNVAGSDGTERPSAAPARDGVPHALDPELLAIETRDLHRAFGANQVLQGLDVTIPEGVISVVLGPSGTGKSVLLQHIIGLLRPDAGDVLIRGRPLSRMSRAEILGLRSEIGVMFQDGALFSGMNVYDNVAFPLRQHTDLDDAEVREVVEGHLDSVGLLSAATRMPGELSGGMRKRAGLARALAMNPRIVLCDEPDSGLDPVRTALLGDLLVEQHARHGGTMVIVTHNVLLARLIADHVSVVWRGKVLESGFADEVFASQTPFIRQFLAGDSAGPLGMDV